MGWSLSCGPDSYARKGAPCEDANGDVSACPGGKPNRKAHDPLYGDKRDHRKKDKKVDRKIKDKKGGRRLAEETEARAPPAPGRLPNPFTGTARRSSISSDGTMVILSSSAKSSSYPSARLRGGPKYKKNPTMCPLAASDDDDDRKHNKKDKKDKQRDNKKADKGRRRL
jgi:hypothetical protein